MPDVYGWVFQADIGVDEALRRLQGVEGYTFAIRESDHEGRYVNGTDAGASASGCSARSGCATWSCTSPPRNAGHPSAPTSGSPSWSR